MSENADGFIDGLLNEIAERVIKKISDSNSNWLNTIQYKVKAENIEGLDDAVRDIVLDNKSHIEEWATDAAQETVNGLEFEVSVR
jgi:hypothetical protein